MLPFDDRDRESVARDLLAEDEEVRRLAVERVEALARDQVVPCLVECLGDASWRVRKAAVTRLVAWPDVAQVTARLIEALHDGDNPGRRNAAVEALIQTGRAALPQLVATAEVSDPDVRKFVVDALAGIGDPAAFDTLVARLADADTNVRGSAADALGALGGERAERVLRDTLADESQPELVRFSALHALDTLEASVHSSELLGVLADPVLRPGALALLGRCDRDSEGVEILLKAVVSDSRSCRESAVRALLRVVAAAGADEAARLVERIRDEAEAESQAVDGALARLPEADLPTQLVLVQFLGMLGQGRAALPILRAGSDEALEPVALAALDGMGGAAELAIVAAWDQLDADERRNACGFFVGAAGQESAERLIEALDDEEAAVRTMAARAVGQRRLRPAAGQLVRLLERAARDDEFEGEEERIAVGDALVNLARSADSAIADEVVGRLAPLIESDEPVRLAAAMVMAGIGRPQEAESMRLLLRDASASVRRVAVDALAAHEGECSTDALHLAVADDAPSVRIAAALALGRRPGDELFEDLPRLADDPDPRVRAAGVRAISQRLASGVGREQSEVGLDLVRRACEDTPQVALAAVEALGRIGAGAVAHVSALLSRPEADVVREAVRCMGLHGDDSILEQIVPLVAHADWSVRAEAIQTLASRRVHRAIPAILRRLDSEQDEYVRSVTLRALQRLES